MTLSLLRDSFCFLGAGSCSWKLCNERANFLVRKKCIPDASVEAARFRPSTAAWSCGAPALQLRIGEGLAFDSPQFLGHLIGEAFASGSASVGASKLRLQVRFSALNRVSDFHLRFGPFPTAWSFGAVDPARCLFDLSNTLSIFYRSTSLRAQH
jgi:hypothetical protein